MNIFSKNLLFYQNKIEQFERPNLTASGTLGGDSFAVTADSSLASYSYAPYKAVDGDPLTFWAPTEENSSWYKIYHPTGLNIYQLKFKFTSGAGGTITNIQGSFDNINYESVSFTSDGVTPTTTVNTSVESFFKYYKFSFSRIALSGSIQLNELEISAYCQQENN